jgi:hypothetical protein
MTLSGRIAIQTLASAACIGAAVAAAPNAAVAGTYPMYQCRDASWRVAPVSSAWSFLPLPRGYFYNTCSASGTFGIRQTPSGDTGNNGGSALQLNVPASRPNVSIARAVLALMIAPKTGNGYSHGTIAVWSAGQEIDEQSLPDWNTGWIDRLSGAFAGPRSAAGPMGGDTPSGARDLGIGTSCFSSCTFSPPDSVQIHQAMLTLREDVAPIFGGFGGTVLTGTPRAGRQTLRYDATDADSGVRMVTALVDQSPVASDDLSGACSYADFNACPSAVRGRDISFDVSRFGIGQHTLAVVADDAAGNRSVQEVGSFDVGAVPGAAGRGAINGRNGSDKASLTARIGGRRSATTDYGSRVVIRGRLVSDDKQPIDGASIDVLRRTIVRGSAMRLVDRVQTGSDGRWRIVLTTRLPSSRLRFAYRSHENDAVDAARADVTLKVRARVRLTVLRHTVRPFGVIELRGRVAGSPRPPHGKLVELRARAKGTRRWIQFRSVRTDGRGRFRVSYRLQKGYRNVTYEFQALARTDPGYPYTTGRSNIERVLVR